MRPALYVDDWTVDPGDRIAVRATGQGAATARLVRLRGLVGDVLPTGYCEMPVAAPAPLDLIERPVPAGSYAITDRGPAVSAGTKWRWRLRVFPTLVDRGEILAWGSDGPRLALDGGTLRLSWQGADVSFPIDAQHWTEVIVGWAQATGLMMAAMPIGPGAWHRRSRDAAAAAGGSGSISGPLKFGRSFSGKVDSPELEIDGRLAARWDFAAAMTRQQVPGDGTEARPLVLVNAPRRAVTGSRWDGTSHDWSVRPEHYDAIHFHDDDLADCCWPSDAELKLPLDTPSGIYAVRVESSGGVRHTPLFVRPQRRAQIAFLASTFSYLAYGNSIWDARLGTAWEDRHRIEADAAGAFGRSTYCRHRDGSGIGLVSTRRPILSFTPGFVDEAIGGQVLLNDDLRILRWLDRASEPYDVITDHDLHVRGAATLAGYRVLVTGVHPEYHSRETLDALDIFAARGGRLMYLGANGFYWRVSTLPDAPHVMEVRRAEGGIRTWAEAPGEYVHQSDGQLGGLWRRLGRPPNRLAGIGFSAQGSEAHTRGYVATGAAHDPRTAFLFEGVTAPVIGAPGPLGAAAGYELDRADTALGTPPHALVIARSQPFDGEVSPVNEERLTDRLLTAEDPLRADIVFFEGPNGGAAFSVGSILFAGALEEELGAGRLTTNCLRRFIDETPF